MEENVSITEHKQMIDMLDKSSTAFNSLSDKEVELLFSKQEDDDPLQLALEEATHIKDDKKQKFIRMSKYFTDNLKENIMCDQFDLNTRYPTYSVDEWNDFLLDRIVSTYIQKHKKTLMRKRAEATLINPESKNKRDSLQMLNSLSDEKDNNNIVILRIPDKYEEVNNDNNK